MGQTNIGIGGHAIPPQGTRGLGFDTQGRPVYIDAAGVPRLIGTDAAIDNVLASYGVGAEADLPAASAGLVYVTNDTYKIYSGVDTGVYDIRDLTAGQFVTDTYTSVRTTYQYIGTELMPVSGGALDVCSQADVELAEPTENTKATSALRAWQGFMYWCTTSVFPDLNTATKTIIGAINELKTNITALFASIRTKQDVNVGFCELCPVLTSDVTRDWSTRTLTIQSTKGGTTVDATNPIRFFTKTNGAKKEWEKTTTQSVQWTNTKGLKYIYFDTDGILKSQDTPWVIADITFVWRLYWNPAEVGVKKIVREAWECHTNSISSSDHVWKHRFGAIYLRGLDLVCNVIPTGAPNADGRNTCLSLTSGSCVDDNLQYDIINSSTPADFSQDMGVVVAASLSLLNGGIFDITYNTPDGTLTIIDGTRIPFHFVGNVPQVISAGGIISPVTDNYFFNYYLYSFQDPRFGKVVSLRSGGQYPTQARANAETWEQVKAASPTLQDGEVRQLYQSQWEYRTSYNTAVKGAALRAFKTLRENAAVSVTAGSSSLLASNVVLTPPTGYASSTNVQIYADENAARVVKLESDETPTAIADTDNVRFKSATGYYVRTLLAIKNYVKLGLKASEVVNDSTNVTGPTVKAAFDNATLAIDGVTIQDADLFPFAREVEAPAGVFTSVNMYHTWYRIKNEIKTNSGVRFVSDATDLESALQAEVDSMCIVVTEPITSPMSNIYPKNVHISGFDITIPDGVWLLNGTSADAEYNIYFDNTINIAKSTSDGTCRIVSVDTKVWNITFRNLQSERGVILSQLGGVGGEINITTTRTQDINIATSQGTRTVTIKNTLDNTGFYYRGFSQQGYNQVYSEITDSGNFTVKAHLTFQKDEAGSIILIPSNSNIMLHPSKFTITYLKSDLVNAGATGISGNLNFPRFDGEGEQVTLSIGATSKAERYIYIVPDGNGSVDYNNSTERAVMLQNGNWVLNYTGSALGTTQQNRVWYSIVITGHADTISGNWIAI